MLLFVFKFVSTNFNSAKSDYIVRNGGGKTTRTTRSKNVVWRVDFKIFQRVYRCQARMDYAPLVVDIFENLTTKVHFFRTFSVPWYDTKRK
jgi:hypothetical protein